MSPWTAAALLLAAGLACGVVTGLLGPAAKPGPAAKRGRTRLWAVNWTLIAAAGLAAGLLLPAAGWIEGRPALWLEMAALLLPVYLAGCALGCLLRRRPARA